MDYTKEVFELSNITTELYRIIDELLYKFNMDSKDPEMIQYLLFEISNLKDSVESITSALQNYQPDEG